MEGPQAQEKDVVRIVVALDLSDSTSALLRGTRTLLDAGKARVWLLHVAEPRPWFVGHEVDTREMREVTAHEYQREHRELQAIAAGLRSRGVDCTSLLVQGETAGTVLEEARRLAADILVVGSHGKGPMTRWIAGSTSSDILRHSDIPVLVVPTHRDQGATE